MRKKILVVIIIGIMIITACSVHVYEILDAKKTKANYETKIKEYEVLITEVKNKELSNEEIIAALKEEKKKSIAEYEIWKRYVEVIDENLK